MTLWQAQQIVDYDERQKALRKEAYAIVKGHERHTALLRDGWVEVSSDEWSTEPSNKRYRENMRYYRCVKRKPHLLPPGLFGRMV